MENDNQIKKDVNIARLILAIIFIIGGIGGIATMGILPGIIMTLLGISLIPQIYKSLKIKKWNFLQWLLPIILITILLFTVPIDNTNTTINDNGTNTITNKETDNKTIEISKLTLPKLDLTIDKSETKNIIFSVFPYDADINTLEYLSTNTEILKIIKNDSNKNSLTLQPLAEGTCEIYIKAINGVESNRILVTIQDKSKNKDNEVDINKSNEQNKKIEENQKNNVPNTTNNTTKSHSTSNPSSLPQTTSNNTANNSNNQNASTNKNSQIVYSTPSGKRYHYDPECGSKNSKPTTKDKAEAAGLTPCQKCAK